MKRVRGRLLLAAAGTCKQAAFLLCRISLSWRCHDCTVTGLLLCCAALCCSAVCRAGLLRRELLVLDTCLAAGVPVAGFVGGGYDRDLDVLAERHMLLHKAALQMWQTYELHSGVEVLLNAGW